MWPFRKSNPISGANRSLTVGNDAHCNTAGQARCVCASAKCYHVQRRFDETPQSLEAHSPGDHVSGGPLPTARLSYILNAQRSAHTDCSESFVHSGETETNWYVWPPCVVGRWRRKIARTWPVSCDHRLAIRHAINITRLLRWLEVGRLRVSGKLAGSRGGEDLALSGCCRPSCWMSKPTWFRLNAASSSSPRSKIHSRIVVVPSSGCIVAKNHAVALLCLELSSSLELAQRQNPSIANYRVINAHVLEFGGVSM